MAVDSTIVQSLIEQLTKERQAYIESANKTHELLQQILDSSRNESKQRQDVSNQQQALIGAALPFQKHAASSFAASTASTGNSSDDDDGDSIFVQTALQPESFDMVGLKEHLRKHQFSKGGKAILGGLERDDEALQRECLFPLNLAEAEADRSHLSHYSIYDVGVDGVPLDTRPADNKNPTRAMEIWNRMRHTNTDPQKRPAVGRIVIVREPSPKLFAALHYTMNNHFDVDELFDLLKNDDPVLMHPHRAFAPDHRHRRTFIITLEYFTIIGEMCKPQKWQRSDEEEDRSQNHVPISRCSAVIALSLEGAPMTKVKNRDRRIQNKFGDVYDPFSPWRVLDIQAYPDWHATTDTHKPTNHYVNGPEAFLYTVEAEFNDARKRLKEVYDRVGDLVEPPPNFIFNSKVREKLLFEDDTFTYSKKYFWAYQTLSIVNQDITEMIESYRDTFKDSVWEGSNKIIWPGESSTSFRYQQFRKRMAKLKSQMDEEIERLEYIKQLNSKKMLDIEALRENLFSGTSVMESRRSVEQARITIEQNRSIMLLTLVTIFFLPLTFVTSVFGMTNMNPSESYLHFAWTTIAVCIPTYLLIGSLHTDTGLQFWRHYKKAFFNTLGSLLARSLRFFNYEPKWADSYNYPSLADEDFADPIFKTSSRTASATRAAMILRQTSGDAQDIPSSRRNSREPELHTTSSPTHTPRPQLTSGDAAHAMASSTKRRSNTTPAQRINSTGSTTGQDPESPRHTEIAFSLEPGTHRRHRHNSFLHSSHQQRSQTAPTLISTQDPKKTTSPTTAAIADSRSRSRSRSESGHVSPRDGSLDTLKPNEKYGTSADRDALPERQPQSPTRRERRRSSQNSNSGVERRHTSEGIISRLWRRSTGRDERGNGDGKETGRAATFV